MAGKQLFANNAKGKLLAGILAGDTQLTLQAGQGALFPAPAGTDWFRVTLIDQAGNIEIVRVNTRAVDTFNPIVRAQEGTIARAFNAADKVELRWTRDTAGQYPQRTDIQTDLPRYAGVVGGTADALSATLASDLTALVDGMRVDAEAASANATTVPTFNLTLGATVTGAVTIKKFASSPLAAGDMAGPGHRLLFQYRAADNSWLLLNPAGALSRALVSVRHAIQAAKLDANGYNAAFAIGAGLSVDLSATATPINIAFANGFDSQGPFELVSQVTADAASAISSIAASNTTFLHATWSSLSAVTWAKCLIPPQYGYAFDRAQASLLNFEGANGSATFLDDFGSAWTASGGPTITTAQFKFGASCLDLTGGGKFIKSVNFTSLGPDSWEVSCWVRWNALPGANTRQAIFGFGTTGNPTTIAGALLYLYNNAGTTKLEAYASGDGGTHNIISGSVGANTVWAINTWYKVRLVFDSLAGTYRVYLSIAGGAETQEISVASSTRVCAISKALIGTWIDEATNQLNGWVDAFRLVRCASNTSAETPSVSAPAVGDLPVHFFSIPQMKMLEVTGASAAAGTDPVFTQRNRVFVGEADSGAANVSAVRNYAVRGEYRSEVLPTVTASVAVNFSDNIGTREKTVESWLELTIAQAGNAVGDRFYSLTDGNAGTAAAMRGQAAAATGRNASKMMVMVSALIPDFSTPGNEATPGGTSFKLGIHTKRAF